MNYTDSLLKVMNVQSYRGCNIIKKHSKYCVLGKEFDSAKEAKAAIDYSFKTLSKTIKTKTK